MRSAIRFILPRVAIAIVVTLAIPGFSEDISTAGWRLWPDRDAQWKNDELFLPDEVNLAAMPVNPPTGGWQALSAQRGIEVTLPTKVEEHCRNRLSRIGFCADALRACRGFAR